MRILVESCSFISIRLLLKLKVSEKLSIIVKMHYHKALVSVLTLAGAMLSMTSASILHKRDCAANNRQFCCAVEEVPDTEILPNLYLFVYGLGCRKSYINQGAIIVWPKTYTMSLEEISDSDNCNSGSSQPHGICCADAYTEVSYAPTYLYSHPCIFQEVDGRCH